jgi:glyoxylase-like metal-dependent hydrolase (beta-lactamase superfamily II)
MHAGVTTPLATDRPLGPHTIALIGDDLGRYPAGNSVLVHGHDSTAIIDPSTSIVRRGGAPATVDRVVLTHAHEDHLAGVHLFDDAAVSLHQLDLVGMQSLDGLMSIYGMEPEVDAAFREVLVDTFTYVPRPDATGLSDGDQIDLGGVTMTIVHLPGHTRGHSGILIEPDGVFVTGDIDLSAFGPYYGDAASDLDQFEASLVHARQVEARHYVTFHHKGVIDGRDAYVHAIDAFAAVITDRERRMVEFARGAPRTLDEFADHRFVYRPHVTLPFVRSVERRSAAMSLRRLAAAGSMAQVDPDCFIAT